MLSCFLANTVWKTLHHSLNAKPQQLDLTAKQCICLRTSSQWSISIFNLYVKLTPRPIQLQNNVRGKVLALLLPINSLTMYRGLWFILVVGIWGQNPVQGLPTQLFSRSTSVGTSSTNSTAWSPLFIEMISPQIGLWTLPDQVLLII